MGTSKKPIAKRGTPTTRRARQTKRRPDELPPSFKWFKLEHYQRANELTAAEWANELDFRLNAKRMFALGKSGAFEELYISIKKSGLITPPDRNRETGRRLDAKLRTQRSTVTSMRVRDVCALFSVAKERAELCEKYSDFDVVTAGHIATLSGIAGDVQKIEQTYDEFAKEKLLDEWPGYAHAVVDLDATNDQIVRNFRRWLESHKKNLKYELAWKQFSKAQQFKSWILLAVLPYLDLTHWAVHTDTHLTDELIGSHIFKDVHEVGDPVQRIQQHTKPKSIELLNVQVIRALRETR